MNFRYIAIFIVIIACIAVMPTTSEGFEIVPAATWYRDKTCKYKMIEVLRKLVDANNLNKGSEDNWSVYIPCSYTHSQRELEQLHPTSPDQKVFIIKGCDNLSRKDNLWSHLAQKYGVSHAAQIMPRTYVLRSKPDIEQFREEYNPHKVYIMKKNIQRQQGLFMTRKIEDILGSASKYVIAQEMLQDPFLIEQRKTNCRYYLLVVCKDNQKRAYIYRNGFMYYTPRPFEMNSTEQDCVITTGYIDRAVYERNPLTLRDFSDYLGDHGVRNPDKIVFDSVGKMLSSVLDAVTPSICTQSNVSQQISFQLFGCDVAFNNRLKPQLIEINKGPDLGAKDERDRAVKQGLITDTFKLLGIISGSPVGLQRIWGV